jgi:hypothetical protein
LTDATGKEKRSVTSKTRSTLKFLTIVILGAAGIASLITYNNYLKDRCLSLDPDKVKLAVAQYYIEHGNKGSVSIIGEDGEYVSYPKAEFNSAQDYLKQYPDCCLYFPDGMPTGYTLHPIQLSFWEFFFGGKCAFVVLVNHATYLVDGVVTQSKYAGANSLIVDNQYQISDDPKDR